MFLLLNVIEMFCNNNSWILISCILRCIQHLSRSSLSDLTSQQSEWPGARIGDCSIYIRDDNNSWILISCILRCIQHLSRSSLSDLTSQQSEWPGARIGDCSIYIRDDVTLGSKSSGSDRLLLDGFDWPILVDSQFWSSILLCSELLSFPCFVIGSVRSFYKWRTWIKGWTKNKT